MTYLRAKHQMLTVNGLIVAVVKQKVRHRFRAVDILLFTSYVQSLRKKMHNF